MQNFGLLWAAVAQQKGVAHKTFFDSPPFSAQWRLFGSIFVRMTFEDARKHPPPTVNPPIQLTAKMLNVRRLLPLLFGRDSFATPSAWQTGC